MQLAEPRESRFALDGGAAARFTVLQESIIDHFGNYSKFLQQYAAPGHWHDPDMLLVGNNCITEDEARTQMAIWVRY